jgi:hypothetical protein
LSKKARNSKAQGGLPIEVTFVFVMTADAVIGIAATD